MYCYKVPSPAHFQLLANCAAGWAAGIIVTHLIAWHNKLVLLA